MDQEKMPRSKGWAISIIGLPITVALTLFLEKILSRWRVLDGPANMVGDFLQANVTASDLGLVLGLIGSVALYIGLLLWVWKHTRLKPKKTAPGPNPLGMPLSPVGGMPGMGEQRESPKRGTDHSDARPDVPDTPMWQAVQHVAAALGDDDEQGCYSATLRAIRQAASQEDILEIWGKRELEAPSPRGSVSEIWSKIPTEYWQNHKINSMAAGERWEAHDHTWGEPLDIHAQDRYFSLRVRRREVAQQWPRDD